MLLCANSYMDRGITVGMTVEHLDFFFLFLGHSGSEEVLKQQMLSPHCIINHYIFPTV